MARGKMNKRRAAISKMVESIINGNTDNAEKALHEYLTMISKGMILGEMEDDEMDDEKDTDSGDEEMDDEDPDKDPDAEDDDDEDADDDDEKMVARDSDSDDDDDEDMDDDEDVKEGHNFPDGAMSRKIAKMKKGGGKSGIEKKGNSSPQLDDKIKGKATYKRYPGKGKMKKHANAKDDYKKGCEGRDKNLGTTD